MLTLRLFKIKMHTRRVLILKRSLPIFAFICVSLMTAWPALIQHKETVEITKKEVRRAVKGAKINMQQVHFFSADEKKQPFRVTAESVQETDPKRKIITLDKPKAEYLMNSGEILYATAPYGFAFQEEEYMYFEQDVHATSKSGYNVLTDAVIVDYKNNKIHGDKLITVEGPIGTLKAQGFLIENQGDHLNFKRKTNTVIFDKEGPVTITSDDGLFIDRIKKAITATKNAVVVQGDKTLKGDKIIMYYTENPDDRLKKVEAFGHVSAETPTERMTGDQGQYDPKTGMVLMTGNVHIYQGSTHLTAPKAEMNLKTGVHSLIQNKKDMGTGRVKGTLIPSKIK